MLSDCSQGGQNDLPPRENFIECIFANTRWTELLKSDPTSGALLRFHTAHKLALMAHSPKYYTELGRLVAKAGTLPWDELSAAYGRLFMEGLALLGTRRKRVNVLQHLMGYLKKELSAEDKQELLGLISAPTGRKPKQDPKRFLTSSEHARDMLLSGRWLPNQARRIACCGESVSFSSF